MNLTIPVDHADAYIWSAVLLAHAFIGLALVAVFAAVLDALDRDSAVYRRGSVAAILVSILYFTVWEGLVQGFDAGMRDGVIDALAVSVGAFTGSLLWARRAVTLTTLWVFFAVLWLFGVRGRSRNGS